MMEALINECLSIDLDVKDEKLITSKRKPKAKKPTKKHPAEPKLTQQYKQSINPSKRHRDRLNTELENLAKLLPFPEDAIARLDKLSILRLSVSFLRNKNYFKAAVKQEQQRQLKIKGENGIKNNSANDFTQFLTEALDGFMLVVTVDGEVFYVSEKVKEHLGYSQSQVLHQPLETLVHDDDREEFLTQLKGDILPKIEKIADDDIDTGDVSSYSSVGQPREFVIRLKSVLNTSASDMYKPFKLSGTIRKLGIEPEVDNLRYALFAFCTPARTSYSMMEIRMKSTLFCSKNRIDLSFLDLDQRGKEFFGYSKKDIFGRSSYVLAHRQDMQHIRCKHTEIITCGKTSLGTFRLMNKNSEWIWVCGYGRVLFKNGKPDYMVTTNRIMSEEEGHAMMKLRDEADRKALKALGLIEPDDPSKAMELGFPTKANNSLQPYNSHSDDDSPVPMPLLPGDVASLFMKQDSIAAASANNVTESTDLLNGAFLDDVDVPERFLNSSADQIMNDPLHNLSPEDFHNDRSSPNESICSDHTALTHSSRHSNASNVQNNISIQNHKLPTTNRNFQSNLSPTNSSAISHGSMQQTQLPPQLTRSVFSEPVPVNGTSSSSSNMSTSPQQQIINAQQFTPNATETSYLDDLTNIDMLQPQAALQVRGQQYPMKYGSVPYPTQMYGGTEAYHRAQQQKMLDEQLINCMNTRPQYNLTPNNRMAGFLNEQVGPNVAIGPGSYDSSVQAQLELFHRRNSMDQRQINFPQYSNNNNQNTTSQTSPHVPQWVRTPQNQVFFANSVTAASPVSSDSTSTPGSQQSSGSQYPWMPVG